MKPGIIVNSPENIVEWSSRKQIVHICLNTRMGYLQKKKKMSLHIWPLSLLFRDNRKRCVSLVQIPQNLLKVKIIEKAKVILLYRLNKR